MEAVDILAEEEGVDLEAGSVARATPVISVEGPDTGPSTARDEVKRRNAKQTQHRHSVVNHNRD